MPATTQLMSMGSIATCFGSLWAGVFFFFYREPVFQLQSCPTKVKTVPSRASALPAASRSFLQLQEQHWTTWWMPSLAACLKSSFTPGEIKIFSRAPLGLPVTTADQLQNTWGGRWRGGHSTNNPFLNRLPLCSGGVCIWRGPGYAPQHRCAVGSSPTLLWKNNWALSPNLRL